MAGVWKYVKVNKTKPHQSGHWAEKKKLEAVTTFAINGSITLTSTQCNIPRHTLNGWRKQDWWKEQLEEIRNADNEQLDAKLSKALDKAIETINDRLENGEYVLDQKTGKIKQIPVKLRDSTVALNTLLDKRQLLRKQPTKIVAAEDTKAQLANLAMQFAQFVTGKKQQEKVEHVVNEFIDGETVEQDADGNYIVKE